MLSSSSSTSRQLPAVTGTATSSSWGDEDIGEEESTQQQLVVAASATALFAADFVSSWLGYISALCVAHPMDTVRVRWQTMNHTPLYTLRNDSFRGLYAGIVGPAVANGPLVGCIFAMNEAYRAVARWVNIHLFGRTDLLLSPSFTVPELGFAGMMAGATGSLLACPVNVIRIQQQVGGANGAEAPSMLAVGKRLFEIEGVAGFYRALPYEALASGIGRMTYFTAYEVLKASLEATAPDWNPTLRVVAAASLTSVVGWASCFPVDIVKNRLQADAICHTTKQYKGFLHCCKVTYRTGGVRAFWTGFSLTIMRSCVSSGISLPVYDTLKPKLRAGISSFTTTA